MADGSLRFRRETAGGQSGRAQIKNTISSARLLRARGLQRPP